MLVRPWPMCPRLKILGYYIPWTSIPWLFCPWPNHPIPKFRFEWSSLCGPSVHPTEGRQSINLVRGVGEAGQTPHWFIRCRRLTEAAIAADGASFMVDAFQGLDTSVRDTMSKGGFVQGAQHPRIFGDTSTLHPWRMNADFSFINKTWKKGLVSRAHTCKLLRSPGIDSQPAGRYDNLFDVPARQAIHRLAESIP